MPTAGQKRSLLISSETAPDQKKRRSPNRAIASSPCASTTLVPHQNGTTELQPQRSHWCGTSRGQRPLSPDACLHTTPVPYRYHTGIASAPRTSLERRRIGSMRRSTAPAPYWYYTNTVRPGSITQRDTDYGTDPNPKHAQPREERKHEASTRYHASTIPVPHWYNPGPAHILESRRTLRRQCGTTLVKRRCGTSASLPHRDHTSTE